MIFSTYKKSLTILTVASFFAHESVICNNSLPEYKSRKVSCSLRPGLDIKSYLSPIIAFTHWVNLFYCTHWSFCSIRRTMTSLSSVGENVEIAIHVTYNGLYNSTWLFWLKSYSWSRDEASPWYHKVLLPMTQRLRAWITFMHRLPSGQFFQH